MRNIFLILSFLGLFVPQMFAPPVIVDTGNTDTLVVDENNQLVNPNSTDFYLANPVVGGGGGGGLTFQGTVTADPNPALLGIYLLDAGGGIFDFTLPSATGSGGRIIVTESVGSTNTVTVKVQSGESTNGNVDGIFIMEKAFGQYTMIDAGAGLWSVGETGDFTFDGSRPILRVPTVGTVMNTSSIKDWLEWWYFIAPTISMGRSPTVIEVGANTNIVFSGSTTNPALTTLSNGAVVIDGDAPIVIGASASYSENKDFLAIAHNETFAGSVSQDYVLGANNGTMNANTSAKAVLPILYGSSATDFHNVANEAGFFAEFSTGRLIQSEGNKTVNVSPNAEYIYYAIPIDWSDDLLSSIFTGGFNVILGFDRKVFNVTSTGLTVNYTASYAVYRTQDPTGVGNSLTYIFNR